ncbi:MAG: UDP-N-acetylmuramate dehydrogenase [Eggerthellaceae bacterium]|nr:UDP-N-acetylmuramate dehydrogenase [Eggerthellaceae bacterium]
MQYRENVPLSTLTTMRLGGVAKYVVEAVSADDLVAAITFARGHAMPWFVLGGGSNVVARGNYDGLIILNRVRGFEKLAEDDVSATYRIGAGEIWDSVVERLVEAGLSGIEAMSAIPGYTGSTPIQNVGAYGQEIADTLIELEAYDTACDEFVTLRAEDCGFSYRNSIFKNPETRHHIVLSLVLRLSKELPMPPFYPSLAKYLEDSALVDVTAAIIREAVVAIRSTILPDEKEIANAGSFFKNPLVDKALAEEVLVRFPDAPHWDMPTGKTKFAAGWLIDQAGLKGYSAYGLQVYPKNALVVTNLCAQTGDDLDRFTAEIIAAVYEKFGITLEQEPETL